MKNQFLKINKKIISISALSIISVFITLTTMAQENIKPETKSDAGILFSNPLFIVLASTIIGLLIIIYSLKGVMKSLISLNLTKIKENKTNKALMLLAFILFNASQTFAQNTEVKNIETGIGGLPSTVVYWMLFVILVELMVIGVLIKTVRFLINNISPVIEKEEKEKDILDSLNASVAIEDEHNILFDHDYDGIKELDNNLPPWWKYGFYLTIFFSIVYLYYFHLGGSGKSSLAEYNQQLEDAKIQLEEYRKKVGNLVDETNAKMLSGADVAAGKEVFELNCAACHGKLGEGGVGPNLTDDYWLYGGSIKDIFKTIKYGYPEKGMKAWENDLSPMQINQVASFIKTLRGTNPPNQKERQGELYNEENTLKESSDSTSIVKTDTANVAVK